MRHNRANHLRQLFHYLYDHGITVTDNLPPTGRMCAEYRQLNAPKPASNRIEQKPPSLFAVRSCTEHRKTPGSCEPGVFCIQCKGAQRAGKGKGDLSPACPNCLQFFVNNVNSSMIFPYFGLFSKNGTPVDILNILR